MRRTTSIGLWLGVVGLAASCSLFARTPLVTPGPAGSSGASDLRTFDEGGLTFTYPAAWHELHFSVDGSFSHLIATLATVSVPVPCATTVDPSFTTIECRDRYHLTPDSLVVDVTAGGSPGFDIARLPAGAVALRVDGQPGYVQDLTAKNLTADDPQVGADLIRTWVLPSPGVPDNFFRIDAFIRGPDLGPIEDQLDAMITSLRYDPPVVPLPSGSAAMAAAEAKALAALVKDSPVWSCFSLSGPRSMVIDSMPNGPPLAHPQLATCSLKIEASPLQLWRMALSIRLSKPDPSVGTGETTVQWINPDGTLGASIGGPLAP
jgi:hypothetical protein